MSTAFNYEDAETVKATLREWALQQQLSQVTLSEDGSTLDNSNTTLPGHVVLIITSSSSGSNNKQCQYTAASIFLQIRDPHQGLLPYRSLCKKHQVQDPVKALDKPMILAYFLGWKEEVEGGGAEQQVGGEAGVVGLGEPTQQQQQPADTHMQPTLDEADMKQISEATLPATDMTTATAMDVVEDPSQEGAAAATATMLPESISPSKKPSSSSSHRHKEDRHHKDRAHHKDRKHAKDSKERSSSSHRSHSDKENKEKHRTSSSGGGSSSKRHHSSSEAGGGSPSKRHKSGAPPPSSSSSSKISKPMTNEQLFSNLNVVVDKRQSYPKEQQQQQNEEMVEAMTIHQALSAEGFQVTPDLLANYQETSQWIASHEIPVGNSASILRATAGRDLKRVLDLFIEATSGGTGTTTANTTTASSSSSKHKTATSNSKSKSPIPSPIPPPPSSAAPPGSKPVNKYLLGKKPIIIVPKAMSAPISMINAHEFFANAKFTPRDVMLKQQAAAAAASGGQTRRGPPPSTFTRRVSPRWLTVTSKASSNAPIIPNNSSTGMLEFEIMDNPTSKLGVDHVREWQRVVAVVSLGQAWQFKDWPGPYGQAVSLFGEHVYGCYIGLEGDSIPPELSGWNVKKSKLSRDKRSMDSVTHANFWNELEEWMAIHKPELLPQTPTNH